MSVNDLERKFDLILNVPGNDKPFKLNLAISGKQLLFMCLSMENGIHFGQENGDGSAGSQSMEAKAQLQALIPELLKKGGPGLLQFYEKVKQI